MGTEYGNGLAIRARNATTAPCRDWHNCHLVLRLRLNLIFVGHSREFYH